MSPLRAFYRHPAVIIRPRNVDEVCQVVSLARETGMDLAIRSGGHSAAGYSVVDDAIVLDLSGMRGLQINIDGRTAWAETGLTAGEYTTTVAAHGLATGFGDTGSVGIGGITLGGGVGYLVRKYGLTIDDLLAAEIVMADGQILQVDADSHPDLFWAIRGGGGNFGVVTEFEFQLHPMARQVSGGRIIFPATRARELLEFYANYNLAAPDDLYCDAILTTPPAAAGKPGVFLFDVCYSGPPADADRALAPLRSDPSLPCRQIRQTAGHTLRAFANSFSATEQRLHPAKDHILKGLHNTGLSQDQGEESDNQEQYQHRVAIAGRRIPLNFRFQISDFRLAGRLDMANLKSEM